MDPFKKPGGVPWDEKVKPKVPWSESTSPSVPWDEAAAKILGPLMPRRGKRGKASGSAPDEG